AAHRAGRLRLPFLSEHVTAARTLEVLLGVIRELRHRHPPLPAFLPVKPLLFTPPAAAMWGRFT
ncbi:MAG: hypothetical protein ACM3UP_02380, partial [Methanocella sp.]